MNVADLSLRKELYELSGWHESKQSVVYNGAVVSYDYTLGYLLRKLPFRYNHYELTIRASEWKPNEWVAEYGELRFRADTPEYAACKALY